MKPLLAALTLTSLLAVAPVASAAQPSPSPKPGSLPIRGVTVDVQKDQTNAPSESQGNHIEAPPLRMFRMNAAPPAPAPGAAAQEMAAPAAKARAAAPYPSPSPSPSPRR